MRGPCVVCATTARPAVSSAAVGLSGQCLQGGYAVSRHAEGAPTDTLDAFNVDGSQKLYTPGN